MLFKYKVYNQENKLLQGEIESTNRKQAHLALLQQGFEVLTIESAEKKVLSVNLNWLDRFGMVSLDQKMLFTKHLSLMIRSGMPINESISILVSEAKGSFKRILREILLSIEGGNHLTDSLAKYPYIFDKFYVSMVQVGEESGSLEQSLVHLAEHLRKSHELQSKIKSALLYPTIVVTAMIGLGFTMAVFVLPKLSALFLTMRSELPWSTKVLLFTSNYLSTRWKETLWQLLMVIVIIFLARRWKYTRKIFHWLSLHTPVVRSFSRTVNLSSFCRALGLLLTSGITLDKGLEIVQGNMSNVYYRADVAYFLEQVKKGESLGDTMKLRSQRFPGIVSKMLKVGERSGNLSETFGYLADYYEEELEGLSRNLSSILEPILLIVIGAAVAFVAMSIITPIYDFTAQAG